jgi:hypothetical protein
MTMNLANPDRRTFRACQPPATPAVESSASVSLGLSVGGIPLSLHISDPALAESARRRYAKFLEPVAGGLSIQLPPTGAAPPEAAQFTYRLDEATLMLVDNGALFLGVQNEYRLDSLIRILLSLLLLDQRGFLLHAATIVRNGRAFLFTGQSGAGKSTIASFAPEDCVLTDEISLVRLFNGEWHAFGTPFWGEFRGIGSNRRVPLTGIYQLVQAKKNHAQRLEPAAALGALLPNVLFFSSETHRTKQLLDVLTGLVGQLAVFRLCFLPHVEFWRVIEA